MAAARKKTVHTKRWNDRPGPSGADDGTRILICRYRPRGVAKKDETWDEWSPELGPSRELHAAVFGKNGPPISWEEYRERYLSEMEKQSYLVGALRARVAGGEVVTLLCSSHCTDEDRCHRSLLKKLVSAPP